MAVVEAIVSESPYHDYMSEGEYDGKPYVTTMRMMNATVPFTPRFEAAPEHEL